MMEVGHRLLQLAASGWNKDARATLRGCTRRLLQIDEPIPRSKLRFMIWAPFFTAKRIACAAFTATGWVLTSKNFTAMISISLTLFAVARIDPASMVP